MENQAKYKTKTYQPAKGDLIKLGIFHGIVEDVYFNAEGEYVVKLFLVKNAFQRGSSELHESGKILGDLKLVTAKEVKAEIGKRKMSLYEKLKKFDV